MSQREISGATGILATPLGGFAQGETSLRPDALLEFFGSELVRKGRRKMTPGIKHFFTKVVGVTHRNDDGTSRQAIIRRCSQLEQLDLVRQKDNPHDPNAMMVCQSSGEQLGYLSEDWHGSLLSN